MTKALVFLVSAMNDSWKLPVAYFLVDGLSGDQKRNLVLSCLEIMEKCGVKIVTLTHDGISSYFTMLGGLGVEIYNAPYFPHPISNNNIHITPHMLKLERNTLAGRGSIAKGSEMIKWEYIEKLHCLAHIQYKKKMCVRLAAQVRILLLNSRKILCPMT